MELQVNGRKTIAGLAGLFGTFLFAWLTKTEPMEELVALFGGLAGVGGLHKLWKAGRPDIQ